MFCLGMLAGTSKARQSFLHVHKDLVFQSTTVILLNFFHDYGIESPPWEDHAIQGVFTLVQEDFEIDECQCWVCQFRSHETQFANRPFFFFFFSFPSLSMSAISIFYGSGHATWMVIGCTKL